jgi:catechol 2,3-dioxygenase-like lactoylglutathione lyase family enzyme
MFKTKGAFSGFSVRDLAQTKDFYANKLELKAEEDGPGVRIHLPGGGTVLAYPKADHQPATFTILNFVVDNIDEAADELTRKGVKFEKYTGDIATDAKGILRGKDLKRGPNIAWFKDPSGNIVSILEP